MKTTILELKQQLAQQQKAIELYQTKLAETVKQYNTISPEKLQEAYDPDNPASTQQAIADHQKTVEQAIKALYSEIETSAKEYAEKNINTQDELLQAKLEEYNKTNQTKLTVEELKENLAPKQIKELISSEDTKVLDTLKPTQEGGTYNPTPPTTPTQTGSSTPPVTSEPPTTDEDEYF